MEIYISQGSVATQLMCGGIHSNYFYYKFSAECAVKNFENWSIFCKDMYESMRLTFLTHPVHTQQSIVQYLAGITGMVYWNLFIYVLLS